MRKSMKIGELKEALKYEKMPRPWIKDDMEVTVHVFPNYNTDRDRKIDVCEQVINNWDIFIDWLWEHRKELKARK